MITCRMAGGQCPNESVATVRIDGVGDRPLCATHRDFVLAQGFGRVLDPNVVVPEWRTRDLARDQTGRVVA